jgi:hypothetical protein
MCRRAQELVPAYRAAVESGDAARKAAAYMEYRGVAKAMAPDVIAAAKAEKLNLLLEWTAEQNLQSFAAGTFVGGGTFDEAAYDVALVLVRHPRDGCSLQLWPRASPRT